jgi:hypothetical protein
MPPVPVAESLSSIDRIRQAIRAVATWKHPTVSNATD